MRCVFQYWRARRAIEANRRRDRRPHAAGAVTGPSFRRLTGVPLPRVHSGRLLAHRVVPFVELRGLKAGRHPTEHFLSGSGMTGWAEVARLRGAHRRCSRILTMQSGIWGPLALMFAIGVRLAKAIIETFFDDWY